jgi:hypothetical protein
MADSRDIRAVAVPQEPVDVLVTMIRVLREQNAQLEEALESRVVIEQAKGVLAERLALRPDEAFLLLRRAARTRRMKLRDLARQVIDSRETPAEVTEVLARLHGSLD